MTDFSENLPASDKKLELTDAHIVDADGRRAQIMSVDQTQSEPTIAVRLDDGPDLVLPFSLLNKGEGDEYRLSVSFAALQATQNTSAKYVSQDQQQTVIPVVQEQLHIDKRVVDTGKGLRIRKTVSEHEQVIDQPLLQDELIVEHVLLGHMVTASELPTTRYDGDTLVVPILEEVLVVEKHTRLKEEVRITRRKREAHAPQSIVLKSEQVLVERFDEQQELFHPGDVVQASHQAPPSSRKSKSDPGKSAE